MSKESIEKQNKMFTDWAMMHNDCMDHNPFYFNPNLWFPSWKVMKKLNEIANIDDLASKIKFYSKNDRLRKKIAKNGKAKYFKLFDGNKISKYIIDISLGNKTDLFK